MAGNLAILHGIMPNTSAGGLLGTAADRIHKDVVGARLQRADDLSEIRDGILLELFGSLRTGRCALPRDSARPHYGRGAVAEVLDRAARQPQYRGTSRERSRLGRHGDDRWHVVPAAGHVAPYRYVPRTQPSHRHRRTGRDFESAPL